MARDINVGINFKPTEDKFIYMYVVVDFLKIFYLFIF